MMDEIYNSIDLFNSITHDEDNKPNGLLETFMDEYHEVKFLKKILVKPIEISAKLDGGELVYILTCKSKSMKKKFIDKNKGRVIGYRSRKFDVIISDKSKNKLELYFNEVKED